jgi:serine/threonine protein kinase
MAQIKKPLHDDGPVNAGEQRLLDFLSVKLPDNYYIVPNCNFAITGANHVMKFWEYDCIVIAPHAIYHIENKDWGGNLEGDDYAWFRSGQEVANPHKTAGLKSRILASKIRNQHADWRFGEIFTLVTLSNPQQSKFGLDPQCDCYKQTFTLGDELIQFIKNYELVRRNSYQIANLQSQLVDYLTGQSSARKTYRKSELFNYKIEEVLQETENFTEYLCVPKLIANAKYKVREYPLDIVGKSPQELQKLSLKVQNASLAQQRIGVSPYIVQTDCRMNEEQTYYYEISRYQDESTLRSKLRLKTFKQTDKINIILDVANALKAAHKEQVYHRDVCPENIFVYDGGKAALANFGMAWFVEHIDLSFSVNCEANLRSAYTAPELLENDANAYTDIYSLGVIFYELMTGKVPFDSVLTFTTALGGVLSKDLLPTSISKDLPTWVDEVVKHTIVADVTKRWQSIDEFIDFIKNALEEEVKTKAQTAGNTQGGQVTLYLKDMKPGMKVSPSMTLHEVLGRGGFGRVFKVWHDMQNRYLAIKIFERDASIDNALNEFEALKELKHPNIVEFMYNDRTVPGGLFYTLMELLDGENLQEYTHGDLRLPIDEVYKMATQILDALVYMQERPQPVFHRDIKPSNIMWHKRQVYKLIDFNISTNTDDKSFAGTFPYMAPDLVMSGNKIDWDCSADTFSLGVTIYELLTQAYPWPGSSKRPNIHMHPTDIRIHNDKLTDQIADFVMRSIITDKNKRFRTAKEMLEALKEIGVDGILKNTQTVSYTFGKDTVDPVDYINSLYSQSHHGNAGTRAGVKNNALDELTYSETKLDRELISDVKLLKYKLIIITGNAGDGKTAFIRRIEESGTNKRQFDTNNGSEFYINGVKFESNYDGSQDEDQKLNDEVLQEFLSPFFGLTDYTQASEGRVIAINEGRLVDFLTTRPELKNLQTNIEDYFYQEGHAELLPGLMVINLNLRSVTAKDGDSPSLLAQQVKRLTRPEIWSKCNGCPVADRCFIKYNVDTFQDSSAGDEVINRLEWLLRAIVYKRELHITMRDLRSMISWMLTRDYSCSEVKQLIEYVQAEKVPEYYWQYYYFNLTAPVAWIDGNFQLPSLESSDRLIRLLRETDLAGVALPAFDRDLYYTDKRKDDYVVFSDRKQSLLKDFNEANAIVPAYEVKDERIRMQITGRHKSFIRHQYFEGQKPGFDFRRRLPYRYISKFEKELRLEEEDALKKTMQNLAKAISASEGCKYEELTNGYMLLASTNIADPISKSYRRFPLDEFELFVNKTDHLTKYIEYESDSLTFRHKTDKFIQLTVSLDLYEMLQYIHEGFTPSVNDLQGRFIELQIFKNLLEAKTYTEILVTKNNRKFTVIRLDGEKHIIIEPLNS